MTWKNKKFSLIAILALAFVLAASALLSQNLGSAHALTQTSHTSLAKVNHGRIKDVLALPTVNQSKCSPVGNPIININYLVSNDADSGTAGNYWALDSFKKQISVWGQADGTYCAIVRFLNAKFAAFPGTTTSPGQTGVVNGGLNGTFTGGYTRVFNATYTPTKPAKGTLPAQDYQCDQGGNCPGAQDWVSWYFTNVTGDSLTVWGWQYLSNPASRNGMWINALGGNTGDITSN